MAGSKQKKRLTTNAAILRNHYIAVGVVNIIYLVYVVFYYDTFSTFNWIGYISLLLGYFFCLKAITSYAKPVESINPENGQRTLLDVNDLSDVSGSLTEYMFDIIYLECFVQLATIISGWFYLILLIIPIFAIYKLYFSLVQPFLQSRSMMGQLAHGGNARPTEADNISDKKRKKLERQEKRQQQQMQRMRIRPQQASGDEDED
ncbi:hypothetical protein C9374_001989 [Naegleria lovaniensis]|uniref:Transmembrane protein 208 n=1 Tax=Naegleria lovaniensis TaxID=51637 RepID=A0AA88GVJ7_NAELO|nr:uncharacterized protein C9374_001989 [Naegleria lovaniensis]KAG2386954.1 hypothetical protein C9374_001989 [Naegleria lovaniensis]